MDEAIMNQFFSAMATTRRPKIARVTKHHPLSLYKARSKSAIVVHQAFHSVTCQTTHNHGEFFLLRLITQTLNHSSKCAMTTRYSNCCAVVPKDNNNNSNCGSSSCACGSGWVGHRDSPIHVHLSSWYCDFKCSCQCRPGSCKCWTLTFWPRSFWV